MMGEKFDKVTVVNDTEVGEAHFVTCDIHYPEDTMRIPFVVYDEEGVFMPRDWQGVLPKSSYGIGDIEWVTMPIKRRAVIMNGLPKLFAGDF